MACAMPLLAPTSVMATVAEPPTAGVTVIVPEELSYVMVIEVPASVGGERRVGSGHQVSRGVDTLDRVAEQDRGQLRQFECHRGGDALGGKEGGEGGVDWREDGEARRRRSERGEHISALRRRRGGDEGVQVVVAGDDREVSVDVDDGVDGVSDAVGRTDIGGLDTIEHSLAATDAEWPAFEAALRSAGWPLPAVSLEGEACRRVVLGEAEALEAEAKAEAEAEAKAPVAAERASHDD